MKRISVQMDSPEEVARRLESAGEHPCYPTCSRCGAMDVYVNPTKDPKFFVCTRCVKFMGDADREYAFASRDTAEAEMDAMFTEADFADVRGYTFDEAVANFNNDDNNEEGNDLG